MSKKMEFGQSAREKMMIGVSALARAVKATMGPRGRNVVIQRKGQTPHVTKDGVTVAKSISFKDAYQESGALLVKQVAQKTADVAGDGTTTSTVLAEAIMREGSKLVAAGHDPMAIKRGMDKACDFVVDFVKSESRPVETDEEVCQVGTISANGDLEIGQMVSSAIAQVGKSGIITLEESSSPETVLRIGSGYEFDRGYITNYFCNDPVRQRVVLRDALVLLVEGTLAGTLMLKEIMPLLEHVSNHAQSLVIIAENIEGEILNTLAVNVAKGALKVVAIKAPGYGSARTEMLKDLGALVGATVLDGIPGTQLQRLVTEEGQLDLSLLGFTPSIEVYADRSVIISNPDSTDAVDARVSVLRAELAQVTDIHDREMLDKRLAKMVGGLASIEVGAATEAEMKEKKDRLEDALAATRAAIQEGVVAGGGVALARAASALKTFSTGNKEEDVGKEVIREAIKVPLWQIATNAGEKGDVIVEAVMASSDPSFGFDAAKLRYGDMFSFGIIDPAKVTRVALQNAVSIAGLVLTTEAVVAFEDDEK